LKVNLKFIFLILISFIGIGNSYTQTLGEIERNADVLFENGDYLEAGKLYLKVISDRERIKDHTLNFKYGTCLLYYKGEKKQEAITYLKRAVKKPSIDVRAFYYLGKAYHYNYQFDLAQKFYEKFDKNASSNDKKPFNVLADINACKNGKKLLSDITNMIVIKKSQIKKENFYELYKLENIGGSILRYDEFQSKYDKKVGHVPIIHFPKGSPFIYFSSYGDNGATGLDIYVVKKLPNNEWSLAQKVKGGVNTFQDENFPYMSADRQFLYFSSKGHNSMGGYDVFRSRYFPDDNTYMAPDNMDFAISSPDDDLFYIVDSLDRTAYFTSARESELGKLTVYQARVEKIPIQMAIIKGKFVNTIDNSNKNIEIIVSNFSNGKEIGTFKSSSRKGSYLITFPNSGKYTFIMTVEGEEISHQAVINVPYLKEFRPLKMTISHLADANSENYLKVDQQFDERFENPTAIMAEVFKEISKLKPNADKFDLDSLDRLGKINEIFVEAGLDPYSVKEDVEKVVQDKIIDLEKLFDDNDNNSTVAFHLADEKLKASDEILEEIKGVLVLAENESDEANKKALLQTVYLKNEKAKALKAEGDSYLELAKVIDSENNKIQGDLVRAKKVLLTIKSVDDIDRVTLGNIIEGEKEFFDEQIKTGDKNTKVDQIISSGFVNKKAVDKINSELTRLNVEIDKLKKENQNTKTKSDQTNKKKLKEKYSNLIAENLNEIQMLEKAIKTAESNINKLESQNGNPDLTELAQEINDPAYLIKIYTAKIHPSDKLKIENSLNKSNEDYAKIDKTLEDNNVNGQVMNLTGLDENKANLTDAEWGDAIDKEIDAQKGVAANSTNQKQINAIQAEIERLNTLKIEKINTGNLEDIAVTRKEIEDNYKAETTKIDQFSNDNERQVAQNDLLNNTIDKVEAELIVLKKELENNPLNTKLTDEIKELEQLKTNLNSKIDHSVIDLATVSSKVEIEEIQPNYTSEKETIANSKGSDVVKAKENITLNTELISAIDTELEPLYSYLESKPKNKKDIEKRITNLEKLKSAAVKENEGYQSTIDNNTEAGVETSEVVSIEQINSDFETKQTEINNIENTNQKTVAQNKLNKATIQVIDNQISTLESKLKNNPTNELIPNQIEELEQLKTNLNSKIDHSVIDLASVTSTVEIEEVQPNYASEKETIANSKASDVVKATEQIALNTQLISTIDTELESLNSYLETKPDNKKDIEKRVTNLEKLKSAAVKENEEYQFTIDNGTEAGVETSEVVSIEQINFDFETKQTEINNIENTNQKTVAQNKLNKATIQLIDTQISTLEAKLKSNPTNELIPNQIEELEQLKTNLNSKIDHSVIDLASVTSTVEIEEVQPNYASEKETIANSKASDVVKATEQIALNTQLISTIDTELESLNSYLETNPENKKDIEKRITNLEKLKVTVVKENEGYQSTIDNSTEVGVETSEVVSIEQINSDFETKQTEINNIENTNQKTVAQNKLNKATIQVIDNQVSTLEAKLKSNPTNELIPNQIEELEQLKTNLNSKIDHSVIDLASVTSTVEIEEVQPNYASEKETIANSKASDVVKATEQIALNTQLISTIDTELESMNAYLETNPENKKDIEKRIKNLEKLKAKAIKENEGYQSIAGSDPKKLIGSVSIGDLIPGFVQQNEDINVSNASSVDKAEAKNKLNSDLISKVDLKITELANLKEEYPSYTAEIDEKIELLTQLKSKTLNDIDENNKRINSNIEASNQTKSNEVADIDVEDFLTPEGKEKVESLEDEISDLNELNSELTELENQKKSEISEKSIQKIDKKISKIRIKQAKIENNIIAELATVNSNEFSTKQSEVVTSGINAKSSGFIDEDILKADEQRTAANDKIVRAKELRIEADETKDPIEANRKYKQAIVLENEAKAEMEEVLMTYETAIVINKLSGTPVINSVDEAVENRQSTIIFNQANELEQEANYYENRANILRDSAETVKRKYRDAILIDVQTNENKSSELRGKAIEQNQKANAIKVQEDELITAIPTRNIATVQGLEKDNTLETREYKSYFEAKSAADEDMVEAKSIENKIKDLKLKSKRKIRMAVVVGGDVETISNDDDIKKLQAEIDELIKMQEEYKILAIQKYTAATLALNNTELSEAAKNNIIAFTLAKEQPKEKEIVVYDPLLADFNAPDKLNQDIFRTTDVPTYNSTKDIPVDAAQPKGLVYKVQIGAFRKEPLKKYFEKFAPVSGESLNNGITRFMVGYFTNYSPANNAKNKVRGMGDYKDAFVVAYYDGKRISVSKARTLEKEIVIPETNVIELTTEIKTTPIDTNGENGSDIQTETVVQIITEESKNVTVIPTSEADKAKAAYYTNTPNAVKANQVEIMKGLFFTVQIGVYSKPVTASALFNVSPVNSQLTPTNKIRYTTGVFNTVAEASSRKSEVLTEGIPDAFVTAYYNGERITVSKAKQILNLNGSTVLFLNQISSKATNNDLEGE